jgi:hypothetical protein
VRALEGAGVMGGSVWCTPYLWLINQRKVPLGEHGVDSVLDSLGGVCVVFGRDHLDKLVQESELSDNLMDGESAGLDHRLEDLYTHTHTHRARV